MAGPSTQGRPNPMRSRLEIVFERALFSFRWLLAPIYFGLGLSLFLLLYKFFGAAWKLVLATAGGATDTTDATDAIIVGVLGLIDISLMANLIVMVVFAGYENFVSRMTANDHPDWPDWMAHIGFAEIKLKLMTSIMAISAIHVLENFMAIARLSDRELAWSAGLHLMFVFSAVLLAYMDRLSNKG